MKETATLTLEPNLLCPAGKAERTVVNAPLIIALLSLTGLLVSSQLYLTIPLTGTLGKTFGLSPATTSWAGSVYGFGYALGFLIAGPLSDRYGAKKVLVPGLALLALSTLMVGFSPTFEIMLILRFIQGLMAASYAPAALAYINEALPQRNRPTAIAFISTGFLLAGLVGQIYASAMLTVYSWQWVFWFMTLLFGLVMLLVAWQLPAIARPKRNIKLSRAFQDMANLFRSPALVMIFLADLAILLSFVAMYSGLGPFVQNKYSVDLLLIRLAGVPGILLSAFSGRFIRRWGNRQVVLSGFVLAASGLGLQALLAEQFLPALVISSVLFVAGIAIAIPGLIGLVGVLSGPARGAGVAVHSFMLFAGASLGPVAVTLLLPAGFSWLCLILALSMLLAAGLARVGAPTTLAPAQR
jgi:predicted MFS family arabinose efflux permease